MARVKKKEAAASSGFNKILVVDDDKGIRELITEALTYVGYEVKAAGDPQVALEAISQEDFDVVLADYRMPDMNGIEMITRMKARFPSLASVLITGHGTEQTIVDAFTKGKINYYLSKPFQVKELIEIVSAAVKEHKMALSASLFKQRLQLEIRQATGELEEKNQLLLEKNKETEELYAQLKLQRDEALKTKNYLENLIASSVVGIISTDARGRITLFNAGAEVMFGAQARDYLARPVASLFLNGEREFERIEEQLKAKGQLASYETEIMTAVGEDLFVDLSVSRLKGSKDEEGLLLTLKDIGDRKRLESELKASNLILEKLSLTDGLTNLFNHRHFQERLKDEFDRAARYETSFGLIILDLDDFKQVNDLHGHQTGDQVLAKAAEIIRGSIRQVDIPARYGGEEFAVILPQIGQKEAITVSERIKMAFERFEGLGKNAPGLRITASLGVACYPESSARNTEELIRFADQALYRAKQLGKNRIVVGQRQGLEPLGAGERLTSNEKNQILRNISQMLRESLDLDGILKYFLCEISQVLGGESRETPIAIMIMDENRQLKPRVATPMTPRQEKAIKKTALRAAYKKEIVTQNKEDGPAGPLTAYPIVIQAAQQKEEVVGVLVVGAIPQDSLFFENMVDQAALGIKHAKLYDEMQRSRQALENKVNELTYLSLMSMSLQHNAQVLDDFEPENIRLMARCLAQAGFSRVVCLDYDGQRGLLSGGADNSLKGEFTLAPIAVSALGPDSALARSLKRERKESFRQLKALNLSALPSDQERQLLKTIGFERGAVVIHPLFRKHGIRCLVIAGRPEITAENIETFSLFLLHAELVMDNLDFTAMNNEQDLLMDITKGLGQVLGAPSAGAHTQSLDRVVAALGLLGRTRWIEVFSLPPEATDPAPLASYVRGDETIPPDERLKTLLATLKDQLAKTDDPGLLPLDAPGAGEMEKVMGLGLWNGDQLAGLLLAGLGQGIDAPSPRSLEFFKAVASMLAAGLVYKGFDKQES